MNRFYHDTDYTNQRVAVRDREHALRAVAWGSNLFWAREIARTLNERFSSAPKGGGSSE